MASPFIHLHVHSHYSLLRALPQCGALAKKAKALGMEAIALTDYAALYGAIEFYKACKKQEIKPIIGVEMYIAQHRMTDKRGRIDDRPYQIVLLAENLDGYKNLLKLSTAAHLEGFYYKPRIDKELLRQHAQGLIGLSGGLKGDIAKALEGQEFGKADNLAKEYADIFGPDNFFIEVQDHSELDEQTARNRELAELAKRLNLPLVGTKDVHYLNPEDAEAHDVLVCVGAGKTVHQEDRERMVGVDYSLAPPEKMVEAFRDYPGAAENTVKIAARCNVEIELAKWKFADFPVPPGKTHDEVLRERAYAGIATKIPEITKEIRERMDYELDVIAKKGYAVYFLVVADYVTWARERGIISTTRGSAAGSLVSYAVDIVPVNPLYFKLPFERFLNPFRPSAPDIDVDFADDRRDEVIAYVTEKYGVDKVAQIGTFGTMAARGAVKDVGRALGLPYAFVDRISKIIPFGSQGFAMTIDRALAETPDLKDLYDTDPQAKQLIDLAKKLEGCARHCSVHAAGVVIAPAPLTEFVPLQREPGGDKVITQFDMDAVGEDGAGVLKMDFLGIRNLSILGLAVKMVKQTKGVDVDLNSLPFNDEKTFKLLAEGHTVGLFQLGGSGMTRYLKELKPTSIFDIQVMVALYRPGPMESIPEYIRRKHDPSLITFLEPRCEAYMKESLGVLVYQDDVMLTAIHLAGYDWMEADKFRKAIGKKIPEEMAKQEVKFREGCKKNSIPQALMDKLWELFKPFAGYGFNKAHAASYAVVAYQTAYMKAHYAAEFMAAVLTCESGDLETVADVVEECHKIGITVLPPDVNSSRQQFTFIDDQNIRFGLLAVKNLGADIADAIIADREAHGPFKSISDLAARVDHKGFNKKALEALIMTGAMDALGERNQLLANIDQILTYHKNAVKDAASGQSNMFGATSLLAARADLVLRAVPPATKREKLAWEKELLGLYVSEHPFKEYAEYFSGLLTPIAEIDQVRNQAGLTRVGGFITNYKEITTKKGELMAFARLEDMSGVIEVIIFPSVLKRQTGVWRPDVAMMVEGKFSDKEGERRFLAESGEEMTPAALSEIRDRLRFAAGRGQRVVSVGAAVPVRHSADFVAEAQVRVLVPPTMPRMMADELKKALGEHPGTRRVVLEIRENGQARQYATSFAIALNADAIAAVERIVGRGAVQG